MAQQRNGQVAAVAKAATLLDALARNEAATAIELARASAVDRTTVHRLLTTLEPTGLVQRSGSTWRLGSGAVGLGGAYVDQSALRRAALPYAIDLQRTLRERRAVISIDVLSGTEMLVVERLWNRRTPLATILDVGNRVSVTGSASGLAVLAALGEEGIAGDPALGELVESSAPAVRAGVERARARQGLAILSAGVRPDLDAMAVAVIGPAGAPIGSLVVAGQDISDHHATSDTARTLLIAARRASHELRTNSARAASRHEATRRRRRAE
ncbi:IclR family transcriptional regulator [Nocardioides humi]|uniref:IclR family transcriptional regulator n=1 Tax=Nocardioides humi TaxID=449461 RepID=A0ABN2A1F3_9ACTN|nr:helix-turn-helix domain-containing protein [Nocardioides humi]